MLSTTTKQESVTRMDVRVKLIHCTENGACVIRTRMLEEWNTSHREVILDEWANPSVRDRLSIFMDELQNELSVILSRGPNLKFGFRPFAQLIGLPLPSAGKELIVGTQDKGRISAPTLAKISNGGKTSFPPAALERMCAIGTADSERAIQIDDWRWKPWHPEEFISYLRGEVEFDPRRSRDPSFSKASSPLYVPNAPTRDPLPTSEDPLALIDSVGGILFSLKEQISRMKTTHEQAEKTRRELNIARLRNQKLQLAIQRLEQENQRLCSNWMELESQQKGEGEIIPLNRNQRNLLKEKFGNLTDKDWEKAGVPKQVGISTGERHAISPDILVKLCNYIGENPEELLEQLEKCG